MSSDPGRPTEADRVRVDIERARAELADTVDALSDRLNVKARAGDKVSEAKHRMVETAARARQTAPPQVQRVLAVIGEKGRPIVLQVSQKAAPHKAKIVAAAGAVVVVVLIVRRRADDDE